MNNACAMSSRSPRVLESRITPRSHVTASQSSTSLAPQPAVDRVLGWKMLRTVGRPAGVREH
jgi:hypothetical protein